MLQYGTIPSHYNSSNIKKSLQAYIEDYLTQEIKLEGLVRNLPAFARFLDSIAFSHGELVNFTNIARDCGIDAKTVKEYYQILIDTLVGYYIYPYAKKAKRDLITATPKFYLFDVGVAKALKKTSIEALASVEAGRAFEHFILLELIAYKNLRDLTFDITYWRTKSGIEVDFVIGDTKVPRIAIEVKISKKVRSEELKNLVAFNQEYRPKYLLVISQEPRARKVTIDDTEIMILNYENFLQLMWQDKII